MKSIKELESKLKMKADKADLDIIDDNLSSSID